MVYAALQLVSRSRENGISVLDLGRSLGIDQKSCFHFVRQLVVLDLVSVGITSLLLDIDDVPYAE